MAKTALHWTDAARAPRSVFMGTPDFAVPSLEALAECTELVGVVSQPDRSRGRGMSAAPSAVSAVALARGVPLIRPVKVRDPEVLSTLTSWRPDLIVVAAYGRILPRALLELPTIAPINVHASLLPRHRGAGPIAAALLAGDRETGITIMLMSEEMDAGDILLQQSVVIAPEDTTGKLTARLAALGGVALRDACLRLRGPGLTRASQDPAAVTYAPRLSKDDGRVRWSEPAVVIERKVRAFTPWPSAFASLAGRTVKILSARAHPDTPSPDAAPGTIVGAADTIRVATGAGMLELLAVQAEGKRPLEARAFVAGARLAPGDRFDG